MNPPKMHVELVPKTCFFTNVRSQVSTDDWDWLRKQAYKAANFQCECCKRKGRLEAHEIWHYDEKKHIQKLNSIVALCNLCHLSMHLGYASIQGKLPQVKKHLETINKWTPQETEFYIESVFEIWYHRSQKKWDLDLTLLDSCNIKYSLITKDERSNTFK